VEKPGVYAKGRPIAKNGHKAGRSGAKRNDGKGRARSLSPSLLRAAGKRHLASSSIPPLNIRARACRRPTCKNQNCFFPVSPFLYSIFRPEKLTLLFLCLTVPTSQAFAFFTRRPPSRFNLQEWSFSNRNRIYFGVLLHLNFETNFALRFFAKPSGWRHNDFVASTKRFVNIASANQNCCVDHFNCYNNNVNCYQNNYCCRRNK